MAKQAVAVLWSAGEVPQVWVDGARNALASPPGPPSGTTSVSNTLEVGRGGRGTLTYWDGMLSFLGFAGTRQHENVMQTMTAAFQDPLLAYGRGTLNLVTDAVMSPVAMPIFTNQFTVNVGSLSYDPAGLTLTCTAATVATGNATVSRSGGTITITRISGTSGQIIVDYTVSNTAKSSSGRVYLN